MPARTTITSRRGSQLRIVALPVAPLAPVDDVAADLASKRQGQEPGQPAHGSRRSECTNADGHPLVAAAGLIAVGSEQAVPPGEIEAEVGIGLVVLDGVVHAMH